MKIKDAIRISISIPLYFKAVFVDSSGAVFKKETSQKNLDIMVDGGIIGNFSIYIFDSIFMDSTNNMQRIPNRKTIGIRIDSDKQIEFDNRTKELAPLKFKTSMVI